MSATLNVAGLLMNLAGVILLFRYGMPYRVRTGGNELHFTGGADQDTVNAEQLYARLGVVGLVLIVLGTGAQVIATVWPVTGSLPSRGTVLKITIEVICAAVVIYILFRENSETMARKLEARIKKLFDLVRRHAASTVAGFLSSTRSRGRSRLGRRRTRSLW
jgi:hypothetical protein